MALLDCVSLRIYSIQLEIIENLVKRAYNQENQDLLIDDIVENYSEMNNKRDLLYKVFDLVNYISNIYMPFDLNLLGNCMYFVK